MELYYYKGGNFGDELNPWIWQELIPEIFGDDKETLFLGIGTLINSNVPENVPKIVMGTGVGYVKPVALDEKWRFYCVRGPLSARSLGLDKSLSITDPAVLLTQVATDPYASHGHICYMPHHDSLLLADWGDICQKAGLLFLDPRTDAKDLVSKIRGAKLVIAEAMHGAIVADAFRVPWIPVIAYDHILSFKWEDWCQSLGLMYRPQMMMSIWDRSEMLPMKRLAKETVKRGLKKAGIWSDRWSPLVPNSNRHRVEASVISQLIKLAEKGEQFLSADKCHHESIERLLEKVLEVKRDYHISRMTLQTA